MNSADFISEVYQLKRGYILKPMLINFESMSF